MACELMGCKNATANPVGIGKTSGNLPAITWYSTENNEEPTLA